MNLLHRPFTGGNTGSDPVRVAGYRKYFILSNLYRSQLDVFIILLTVSLRYPLKSTVSKPTEFAFAKGSCTKSQAKPPLASTILGGPRR